MLQRFACGMRTVMASSIAPPHTLPGGALLHQDSRGPEAMEDHGWPASSPRIWDIWNQASLIGDFLDVAWHLTDVHRKPMDHNHPG